MDNQLTDVNKALFSAWVSDPSEISFADAREIEAMALKFPYCQILQFLVTKSAGKSHSGYHSVLAKTSLYAPDRRVLYTLINHPDKFKTVTFSEPEDDTYYEVIEDDDYSADLVAQEPQAQPETTDAVIDEEPGTPIDNPDKTGETEAVKLNKETVDMNAREEEEKTILENIAATDYFIFDEKLDVIPTEPKEEVQSEFQPDNVQTETADTDHEITPSGKATSPFNEEAETNEVARYDDDSMPYSFLWWLHKTRKEHADTYQPYVDFKLDTNRSIKKTSGPELNQQMIENIFHLQSPLDELERKATPQTVSFDLKRKEEEIIEKFIRDEPQIHPPSPDKLDLENKARKSAEDPNDLVSETLAAIYTEQMLFHKAIDTYQKLSLKFPEKKGYFADQISELQKKIN